MYSFNNVIEAYKYLSNQYSAVQKKICLLDSEINNDIRREILGHCDIPEIGKLSQCSHDWNVLTFEVDLWKYIGRKLQTSIRLDDRDQVKVFIQKIRDLSRSFFPYYLQPKEPEPYSYLNTAVSVMSSSISYLSGVMVSKTIQIHEILPRLLESGRIEHINTLQQMCEARDILKICEYKAFKFNLDPQYIQTLEKLFSIASEIHDFCCNTKFTGSCMPLSNLQLTSIPSAIGMITNIKILVLKGNQIVKIPKTIKQLKRLSVLTLDDDLLLSLSDEPLSCLKLRNLLKGDFNKLVLKKLIEIRKEISSKCPNLTHELYKKSPGGQISKNDAIYVHQIFLDYRHDCNKLLSRLPINLLMASLAYNKTAELRHDFKIIFKTAEYLNSTIPSLEGLINELSRTEIFSSDDSPLQCNDKGNADTITKFKIFMDNVELRKAMINKLSRKLKMTTYLWIGLDPMISKETRRIIIQEIKFIHNRLEPILSDPSPSLLKSNLELVEMEIESHYSKINSLKNSIINEIGKNVPSLFEKDGIDNIETLHQMSEDTFQVWRKLQSEINSDQPIDNIFLDKSKEFFLLPSKRVSYTENEILDNLRFKIDAFHFWCVVNQVRLARITRLNLSECDLTSLPPEIKLLKNLCELNLNYNQLNQLPAEIEQLKNLTILTLEGNPLSELPDTIGQLKKGSTFFFDEKILFSLSDYQRTKLSIQCEGIKEDLSHLYLNEDGFSLILTKLLEE